MKIEKMYQGTAPDNKILNTRSSSETDTYSCRFLLDYCHPIGELFLTIDSNFNPNNSWGGTWIQLTSDAYLKIVTSNGGSLGGTSNQHKIPVASLPAHSHTVNGGAHTHRVSSHTNTYGSGYSANYLSVTADTSKQWDYDGVTNTASEGGHTHNCSDTGSGQAYYPYYYGMYAWLRTA